MATLSYASVDTNAFPTARCWHEAMDGLQMNTSVLIEGHVSVELEINDYSPAARAKIIRKSTVDAITDSIPGTRIESRGVFVSDGKAVPTGERKLYLIIEGPTPQEVLRCKAEILTVMDDEAAKNIGSKGSGRFNMSSIVQGK